MSNQSEEIAEILRQVLDSHRAERDAQMKQFKDSIDGLRFDFRIFNMLTLAGILALAGINVAFNVMGTKVTAGPSITTTFENTTPAHTEPTQMVAPTP
jgi:hypothetical protein